LKVDMHPVIVLLAGIGFFRVLEFSFKVLKALSKRK